ncbi:MAG: hypothetical protein AAF657_14025 [Acidobacteriota bacterium]
MASFQPDHKPSDGDALMLRRMAISAELDRLDVPATARPKLQAVLKRRSFPLGDEISDRHAKAKLINQAAGELAAKEKLDHAEFRGLRELRLLGCA